MRHLIKLFKLSLILQLIIIGSFSLIPEKAFALDYFGYFRYGAPDDLNLYTDAKGGSIGYTNPLVHANLLQVNWDSYTLIPQLGKIGIKSLVSNIFDGFFAKNCTSNRSITESTIPGKDFMTWYYIVTSNNLVPYIGAIYLKDEPYLNAAETPVDKLYQCTPEQVTARLDDAARIIKIMLPNIPIVIADPLLDHDRIQSLPTNVDWFGLSLYPTSSSDYESFSIGTNPELNKAGYTELRMSVNSYINKLKNKVPGKKILLIPVAYKLKDQEALNTQDMMDLTKKYFELAYSEPAIVAVLPYVVNSHPEDGVWLYSALDNPKLKTAYNNFSQTLFGLPNIALGKQVQSLVVENTNLYPASNLTDGDESTLSYPNALSFDYVIDLGSTYKIDAIRLVLKHFGLTSTSTYITSWEVNGIDANGNSSLIRSGSSSPNSEYVGISKIGDTISSYKKIRIKAQSTVNWIGIFETQVFGVPGIEPPKFAYSSPFNFKLGESISPVKPVNLGGPISSCSMAPNSSLPPGLTLDYSNCSISGTPTSESTQKSYTVRASNSGGYFDWTIYISVLPAPPIISYSNSTFTFNTDTPISPLIAKNTGGVISSCVVSPDSPNLSLPSGLNLDNSNCTISGTPKTASSQKTYRIRASNSGGYNDQLIYLTINQSVPASTNVALGKPVTSYITGDSQYVYPASNLTDGNESTQAYPASMNLDYEIDLQATYKIDRIRLVLGGYGLSTKYTYITSGQIYGIDANGNSFLITSTTTSPNSEYLEIPLSASSSYRKIRIKAQSTSNWIGILEAQVFGVPGVDPPKSSPNIAFGKPVTSYITGDSKYVSPASNLTDGSESTYAYPANVKFDYEIDLQATYKIDRIRLVLKNWGLISTNIYITSGQIYGIDANGNSFLITSTSASPNSEYLEIPLSGSPSYRKIRIAAQSTANWIGIYEAQVFGVLGVDPPKSSPNIAFGKPVTSYITGASQYVYPASNLTDGNESTIAYPANVKFDYEIDLQATYKIERIRLVLGYWGLISTNIYITSWQISGIDANGNSKLITSSSTSPNSEYVDIPVSGSPSYKKVRIAAQSTANWIGIYEAQVFGAPN